MTVSPRRQLRADGVRYWFGNPGPTDECPPSRGPVMLALPQDILDQPSREPVVPTVLPVTGVAPEPETIQRAVQLLAGAESPIIVVGDGVGLAQTLGVPARCVSEPAEIAPHPAGPAGNADHII